MAGVGRLRPYQNFESKLQFQVLASIAEPPLSLDQMAVRADFPLTAFAFPQPIEFLLTTDDKTEQMTKAFSRQVVVSIQEIRNGGRNRPWQTKINSDFAPALGFPIRQVYSATSRYKVSCELTAIDGPGAVIAAAPSKAASTPRPAQSAETTRRTSTVLEAAQPGAFRIAPAGTVATYQCDGSGAKTVEYAIEAVEGDTLTVKVTGDGEDFGTYRRKAWQMVGTTLYEELNYKGKITKGGGNFTKMAGVGRLQPYQKFESKLQFQILASIAEPPLSWEQMAVRADFDNPSQVSPRPIELSLLVGSREPQVTQAFGTQIVVSVKEIRKANLDDGNQRTGSWQTSVKSDFAPALGFPIRQEYSASGRYKVTCALTKIEGLGGAAAIATAPSKAASTPRPAQSAATTRRTSTVLEAAQPGAFRIPPAGTVATYQCDGSGAKTVEYAIEAVEGDMLTVKVTGDGENFGTYRRKAWQMVGTTLYEELTYKGKITKGDSNSTQLAAVGALEPGKKYEAGQIELAMVTRLGAPPIKASEAKDQTASTYGSPPEYSTHNLRLTVGAKRQILTTDFGQVTVVTVDEQRMVDFPDISFVWTSSLRTDFAPALGLPIHQTYEDKRLKNVTCELAAITGPGAQFIAIGPVTSETRAAPATPKAARSDVANAPELQKQFNPTVKKAPRTPRPAKQASSSVAFTIPAEGTVATYECRGGNFDTVEYFIEAVEGDTLTVIVTGDGEDLGTYRRKAWQMVGTTLYESLTYRGKSYEGDKKALSLAAVGRLEPGKKYKVGRIELAMVARLAVTPIDAPELYRQLGNTFQLPISVFIDNLRISVGAKRRISTTNFGQ